jgi:hypothetical protein
MRCSASTTPPQLPTGSKSTRPWGEPRRGLIPLPILPPRRKYINNLLSLAANLPKEPRIDTLAAPPWKLDYRHPRLSCNHKTRHGDERRAWSASVHALLARSDHLTVFSRDSRSNWNRGDDLKHATGITSTFANNHEIGHATRQLGFSAIDINADLCALASAASQAHLNQNRVAHVTIFATSPAAIQDSKPLLTSVPTHGNLSLGISAPC